MEAFLTALGPLAGGFQQSYLSPDMHVPLDRLKAALADRYGIDREIGAGGMATVYLAEDLRHERHVAVKVLRPELSAVLGQERFLREIKTTAQLNHPHILPLHDSGEADGFLYYVMPYVEGESLRDRLNRETQLAIDAALHITREIADALNYAHSHDVIHRDIKPENILLSGGHAVVADFGIARAVEAAGGEKLTQTGMAVGTPVYMSPEQATGSEAVDGRSDTYSLGCVLYEMLSGEPPYTGPTGQAIIAKRITDPVPSARRVRETIPRAVDEAVTTALAKVPADRFVTCAEFAEALAGVHASAATPTDLTAADFAADSSPRVTARTGATSAQTASLRRPAVVGTILAIATVLGTAGWWQWRERARDRWVRDVAIPEIQRFTDEDRFYPAFQLASEALDIRPDDPEVRRMWAQLSGPVSVLSDPSGADVFTRDYHDANAPWDYLGMTPVDAARVPIMDVAWRVVKDGFESTEGNFLPLFSDTLRFHLAPTSDAPPRMVRAPGGTIERYGVTVQTDPFWIDRYEVTNREFKAFVDGGGYRTSEHWPIPMVKEDRNLTFEEAVSDFHDAAGRIGPLPWELGAYPEGEDDLPVRGVSWYEAAAYCKSVDKALPTVFHWFQAARTAGPFSGIVRQSNFSGERPAPVGNYSGLGPYGTYDMAGNVKEWVLNSDGDRRYILGGAWNEPAYMFTNPDAELPFSRETNFGVRCARYDDEFSDALFGNLAPRLADYRNATPVSDEVFTALLGFHSYDETPLEAAVEWVDESPVHWRRERITYGAAYGGERVILHLFIPKNVEPPYQVTVYAPGSDALSLPSSDDIRAEMNFVDFVVRSGRVVAYPVYKGTYERREGVSYQFPNGWRDVIVQWGKDLGRTVDYLETRDDIDRDKMAFYGLSLGASLGVVMTAVEKRFKASVLLSGGLPSREYPPEVNLVNFAARVTVPTLMLNGKHDFGFRYEEQLAPLFRLLGVPDSLKRHTLWEGGHAPPRLLMIRETLDWFDRYLGRVDR